MCSQPPKKIDDSWILKEAFEAIRLIPRNAKVLGFTGGEPTIFGQEFINLLDHTKSWLPHTSLHVLSNGRYFADENFDVKHDKPFLLSMANSGPNTNSSQFFVTFRATPWLDGHHTVFGEVIEGLDVLKALEKIGSGTGEPTLKALIYDSGII